MMPLVVLPLPRHLLMLWNRSKMIRPIPSHLPSRLLFNRSRTNCVVPAVVVITSLVLNIRLLFSTMMVCYPLLAATWQQVCIPAPYRIFCKIWEAIPMFKSTILARSVPNCRELQPHNPHHNPPINQHNRYITSSFIISFVSH